MRIFSIQTLFRRSAITLLIAPWLHAADEIQPGDLPDTLQDYLEQGQVANPDLQAYAARYQAARERIPQAAALPDPMLQISHFVESVQTRTGPQKNIVALSQRLPWFGQLDEREQAAEAEAEAIQYAFQARQLQLTRLIGLSFYDYAYTGKAIELTTKNLGLLEELLPQVEERVRTGGDLNALLRMQVEISKLRDRLASLQQQRPQQNAKLAALLALPGERELPWPSWHPTTTTVDQLDSHSLLASVETNNPELLMLERKISSSKARTELARLERRPSFTLGLNYIQIDDPSVNPTTPDAGQDPWALTFAVNLPIWNKRTTAVRREAQANQRAAESELANRQRQLRGEVHSSLAAYRDARRRVALYHDELLPLAQQALEITRASYEGGRATLLEMIDSERSLLDLELQLWRAQADAAQQRVILLTLSNRPL